MKKNLTIFAILITSINCYSQINFEKGFYINNDGQKKECLIENNDWSNNPTEFIIKLNENDNAKTIKLYSIKEITIYNASKYIKALVNIDISSNNLQKLDHEKKPIFNEKLLLLKVLVEGEASLYYYKQDNRKRFFYKNNNDSIEQLVFKSYLSEDKTSRKYNNQFRQQLWTSLRCENISIDEIEKIDYQTSDLVNLFIKYNKCKNSEIVNYEKNDTKHIFNLNLRPRINNSSLDLHHYNSLYGETNFDNNLNFGLGVEVEYVLPFNKNKWAILVEPTYQYFNSELITETTNVSGGKLVAEINYQSLEIPIGFRYYFILNEKSKFFINLSYAINFDLNSSLELYRADGSNLDTFDIDTSQNLALGIGYQFMSKYSLELRFYTNRDLLINNNLWSSDFKNTSIIFAYTLF